MSQRPVFDIELNSRLISKSSIGDYPHLWISPGPEPHVNRSAGLLRKATILLSRIVWPSSSLSIGSVPCYFCASLLLSRNFSSDDNDGRRSSFNCAWTLRLWPAVVNIVPYGMYFSLLRLPLCLVLPLILLLLMYCPVEPSLLLYPHHYYVYIGSSGL